MPLQYAAGTIAEHRACRESAVVFDVSHLGTVRVDDGEGLQRALTNDLDKIGPGRAQYTHLLDEEASVLDDIIVWWIDPETFDVMPNASNTSRVVDAVGGEDVTGQRAVIAAQGPLARRFVGAVSQQPPTSAASASSGRMERCAAGRRRYRLHGRGRCRDRCPRRMRPDGYGTRSSLPVRHRPGSAPGTRLRLEAGLPLHGHELGAGITPLQAGLGWVVAWDKPGGFVGRDALDRRTRAGLAPQAAGNRHRGPPAATR